MPFTRQNFQISLPEAKIIGAEAEVPEYNLLSKAGIYPTHYRAVLARGS
jgi:hypothetical protein